MGPVGFFCVLADPRIGLPFPLVPPPPPPLVFPLGDALPRATRHRGPLPCAPPNAPPLPSFRAEQAEFYFPLTLVRGRPTQREISPLLSPPSSLFSVALVRRLRSKIHSRLPLKGASIRGH